MKYTRLTKEQFEELHQEFARFLASQSITRTNGSFSKRAAPLRKRNWTFQRPNLEGALAKVMYLENRFPTTVVSFKLEKEHMSLIVVKP